jgi:excisionase family DNA binding protein
MVIRRRNENHPFGSSRIDRNYRLIGLRRDRVEPNESGKGLTFASISSFFDKLMTTASNQFGTASTAQWLTAAEAAQYLKVKARTLLLWVRQGKVKAFALSGTKRRVWRFRQMDLDAALLEPAVLPSESPSVRPAERMDQ